MSVAAIRAQSFEELIRTNQTGRYLSGEGQVRYLRAESPEVVASANQVLNFGDALRTLDLSWAALRFSDGAQFRMKYQTRLQIERRPDLTNYPGLRIDEGAIYVTSRGGPQSVPVVTPHARGVPKGTEFLISVDAQANRTEVIMFDGEVDLQNAFGSVRVPSGWQGVAEAGQTPRLVAAIPAHSLVQWWIYYPAILNPDELALPPAEEARVSASLAAYREGDLLNALQRYPGYPDPALPSTDPGTIYLSALLLAVGAVERSLTLLTQVDSNAPLSRALHTMIAAVSGRSDASDRPLTSRSASDSEKPLTTSELLALSYAHQSTNNLPDALAVARAAVERAPNFSFGWARVAELEFSFGRTRRAREAVGHSLTNAPRNAQALALNGFLLAADSRTREAIGMFNRAIEVDPGLGNAWLGRGLCKRRLGWSIGPLELGRSPSASSDGREGKDGGAGTSDSEIRNPQAATDWLSDLQTAAILEPRRSLLRSYAGKAFGDAGELRLAEKELAYAKHLDTNDPTPWLYSALLKREQNRVNEAIGDLEESIQRNDNRAVYRSQLMLDEDRAVRSSSLANLYQSAGLDDVSVAEAARAVSFDYANHSAHQFLAESYNALRDPARFNLRYETAWLNELLLANLLSPVGATPLSQRVSQQEYARLFDSQRIGLITDTSYRSDGQYREICSQYGMFGATAWSLDLDYQHNDGVRVNNELDRLESFFGLKHQITSSDSILLLAEFNSYRSGDNYQRQYPTNVHPDLEIKEEQPFNLLAGFHRQWVPGSDTLILGGVLRARQQISDTGVPIFVLRQLDGTNIPATIEGSDQVLRNNVELLNCEANHIWKRDRHTLVVGGRIQSGTVDATGHLVPYAPYPTVNSSIESSIQHSVGYGYYHWQLLDPLLVTAGVSYDYVKFPTNHRFTPLNESETTREELGPKGAFIWTPAPKITIRGAYTKSLGGATIEESYRLQPTQLAGFVQSFRSIMPDSIVGSISAPRFETAGMAIDFKLREGTYLQLQGDWRYSDVDRQMGTYYRQIPSSNPSGAVTTESSMTQKLDYTEQVLTISLNQLIATTWSLGLSHQVSRSTLQTRFPAVDDSDIQEASGIGGIENHTEAATLHLTRAEASYNHSSGIFSRGEFLWLSQANATTLSGVQSRDVAIPQVNLFVGYRLRQRGDITLGVLNLTGEDEGLSPLTPHPEFPHERVMVARLRLRF